MRLSQARSLQRSGPLTSGRSTGFRVCAWLRLLAFFSLGLLVASSIAPPLLRATPEPRSTIGRPLGAGPIYLVGTVSTGGAAGRDDFRFGYGASLLFRPHAAADFLSPLYDWNTAIVLQADYRSISGDRRLLAADFILRRYLSDMRRQAEGASLFIGLGAGGAEITYPLGGAESGSESWFSYLAELGYEYSPDRRWVLAMKGQWRLYEHNSQDYSNWSLHIGFGIPIPW